jgi:hypothetical protein
MDKSKAKQLKSALSKYQKKDTNLRFKKIKLKDTYIIAGGYKNSIDKFFEFPVMSDGMDIEITWMAN